MDLHADVIDKDGLTTREADVLKLMCEGKPDKVIARMLAISIKTVEAKCSAIYEKLQVKELSINHRVAAVSSAVARGMVRLSTRLLCVALMIQAVSLDDEALMRVRSTPRVTIARVKVRE